MRIFDILPNFLLSVSERKHGIYTSICKLPHELANDLTLKFLGNQESSEECQDFMEL